MATSTSKILHCNDFPEFLFYYSALLTFVETRDSIARKYFADYVIGWDVPSMHLVLKVSVIEMLHRSR